jgi:hypothetical protein
MEMEEIMFFKMMKKMKTQKKVFLIAVQTAKVSNLKMVNELLKKLKSHTNENNTKYSTN